MGLLWWKVSREGRAPPIDLAVQWEQKRRIPYVNTLSGGRTADWDAQKELFAERLLPAAEYAASKGVTLAMDQYVLPEDFDRPTGEWEDFLSSYHIRGAGPEEFAKLRRSQGRTVTLDDPKVYTVYGLDPSESYQVLHLHPWPQEQTMLQYYYQRLHPTLEHDVDHVLFPQTQLGMIMEAVIYLANRDYEDDQRMQAALMEFMQQFKTAKGANMVVQDKKILTPWRGGRARSVRDIRGMGGARYDYGEFFDVAGNTKLP